MHCLGCDYDLGGVAAGACPECARLFDPADAETWSGSPAWRRKLGWRVAGVAAVLMCPGPLWAAAGLGVEYWLAWSVLGHRPRPSIDDPKTINSMLSSLHDLVALLLLFSPAASLGAIALAGLFLGLRGVRARWVGLIVFAGAAWPLSFLLSLLYPGDAITWWFD
jgi:hypothetical protein